MSTTQWVIDACPDANGHHTLRPANGTSNGDTDAQPIATVYTVHNARLIAAAPDLLAAAIGMRMLNGSSTRKACDAACDALAAAIAKATA